MVYYLSIVSEPKSKLTLQNFNGLIEKGLIPNELNYEIRTFAFNKYLKKNKKGEYYLLNINSQDLDFYADLYDNEGLEIVNGIPCIKQKTWDKIYKNIMDAAREWLKENQQKALLEYNTILFKEAWDKYAKGSISAWEMEALCFYYHEHELKNVDMRKYGYEDFFGIPENPIVIESWKTNTGHTINKFQLYKICGTCIAKDKIRSTVTLLTTSGVVDVKFRKEYFSLFDKQISARGDDGVKHRIESSWFNRGSMIVVQGIRSGDTFIPKKYSTTQGHQLYRITEILPNGEVKLQTTRAMGELDEDD